MMHTRDCDVVIVGARPAGAATAMLLAQQGLDVVVVDRARPGSDTLSTHALMRGAIVQLGRWGLLDRIRAAGTPPVRRTTYHLAGRSLTLDFPPAHGVDALYAPRRTILDPLLATAAVEAGAHLRYGVTVDELLRDTDGRVVGVTGGDDAGEQFAIRARYVVGADGMNSLVARRTGAPIERLGAGVSHYLYQYWSGVEWDGFGWAMRPGATAGLIPTNDGNVCVFVGSHLDAITVRTPDLYAGWLTQASPVLAAQVLAGRPEGRIRRFVGRASRMLQPWGPGWVLVGDAGYWKDPISAHGITDALRDAELAARAIAGAVGTPGTSEAAWMREFHDTRNRLSLDLFEVTDRIASGDWTDESIPLLLLQLSESMNDELIHLTALDDASAGTPGTIAAVA